MQGPHAAWQVGAAQGCLQQATHRLGYCFVLEIYIVSLYFICTISDCRLTVHFYESQNTQSTTMSRLPTTHCLAHHSQHSSSLADGRHQVLIEDLILRRVELLQFHQGGEHHVKLVPLCEQVRHRQQLQRMTNGSRGWKG